MASITVADPVVGGDVSTPATLSEREFYETLYQQAHGERVNVPWSLGAPNPALVAWLNAEASSLVRPGCRVVVIGCGLGDDAIELIHRGFDVTAFDCSPTAVEWAKQRFPRERERFCVADVCSTPSHWRHRFDLVVEINTLCAVAPTRREALARGVVDLLHPNGVMLAICPGRDATEAIEPRDGPPYPFTSGEMRQLLADNGLTPTRALDDFLDDSAPPKRCLRAAFYRGV